MQVIFGIIYHFIGGFASGSFYMPYKKVRGWHWESYWIVGGLFSWLIIPPLAAYLTIPGFVEIILKEWNGEIKKNKSNNNCNCNTYLSVILVGYGNSLKQ